jgi:hypothetical protein
MGNLVQSYGGKQVAFRHVLKSMLHRFLGTFSGNRKVGTYDSVQPGRLKKESIDIGIPKRVEI